MAEAKENVEREARKILGIALALRGRPRVESVVAAVEIPSDDMKGRIIGREGRNIPRLREGDRHGRGRGRYARRGCSTAASTGVRRETARRSMEKLVRDGRIHPAASRGRRTDQDRDDAGHHGHRQGSRVRRWACTTSTRWNSNASVRLKFRTATARTSSSTRLRSRIWPARWLPNSNSTFSSPSGAACSMTRQVGGPGRRRHAPAASAPTSARKCGEPTRSSSPSPPITTTSPPRTFTSLLVSAADAIFRVASRPRRETPGEVRQAACSGSRKSPAHSPRRSSLRIRGRRESVYRHRRPRGRERGRQMSAATSPRRFYDYPGRGHAL